MNLRSKWRVALGWTTPARVVAALVFPLVVAGGLALSGWIPWRDLLVARTVAVFALLASLAAAVAGGLSSGPGRRRIAAAWVAGALALGAGASILATLLEGKVDAGLDEEGAPWSIDHAGLAARPPAVKVLELPSSRAEGSARLLVDGREMLVAIGREVAVGGGRRIAVRDIFFAPAFEVDRSGGPVEGSALVKLEPGRRDWFTVGVLPHRFYVTVPPPSGPLLEPPPSVHLRVQRGKVCVYEGDLAMGSEARFEGLTLRFEKGAPWARIELRSCSTPLNLVPAGLAVAAVFLAAQRRRSFKDAEAAAR